ncbi:tRNA pseudouridine(55) synthase TruB (plasmid) [Coraliomargarita sp. W4R53]
MTSHDVVKQARKALGTRKIGHAGTLDPMATGLLILGVDAATRLLTFIVGLDKTYEATIRLGMTTDTDDAEGAETARADTAGLAAITDAQIHTGIAALTGVISQVPSTVSAIRVNGRRAYDLARAGEEVVLKSRTVTVSRFEVHSLRRTEDFIDLDVVVDCSTGTYIRALARDLGAALGVGGHLTALRRNRIGSFDVADGAPADDLANAHLAKPAAVASRILGRIDVTDEEAVDLRHGKRLKGAAARLVNTPAAAVDPHETLIGVVEKRGNDVSSTMNMPKEHTE